MKSMRAVTNKHRISIWLRDIKEVIKGFKNKIFIIAFIIFFITFFLAYIISLRFAKPIRMLTDASEKVANGDFNIILFKVKRQKYELLCGVLKGFIRGL